jgi:hypothetical protein
MPPYPDPRVNVASGAASLAFAMQVVGWLANWSLAVGWLARICWPTRKFVLAHEFQAVGTKMRVWDSSKQKWFLFEQLQQCHLTDLSAKTWTCKVPVNMRVRQSMPRYL